MKIGTCRGPEDLEKVASMGYDYIETTVGKIKDLDDKGFKELLARVSASPISFEAFNVLFPGGIQLTGPEADLKAAKEHIAFVFPRLKALGGDAIVFGSGGARRVPEGYDKARAFSQLVAVGEMLGRQAIENGLTLVLEPLNSGETNIINTQVEGMELVRAVNHPGFKILADWYHVRLGSESGAEVEACGQHLKHTHIANPAGRISPVPGDGEDYAGFFTALKSIGYTGRMSYEGKISDFDSEGPATLKFLRELAAAAGL